MDGLLGANITNIGKLPYTHISLYCKKPQEGHKVRENRYNADFKTAVKYYEKDACSSHCAQKF